MTDPVLMKLTCPLLAFIVAIALFCELQIPFAVVFDKLMELPTQPPGGPLIGATIGVKLTTRLAVADAEHPLLSLSITE